MTARLSEELQQEIARHGNEPIKVVDPGTQKVYVLISADVFERVRSFFDESFNLREAYAAQDAALAQIWDDAELDEYADYDRHKSQP
jgi:hypothetical protein